MENEMSLNYDLRRRKVLMGFWESTFSSAIGSFVGVGGAFWVAKWQLNKTQKQTHTQFYIRFNEAQIYLNNFEREVEEILEITQSDIRKGARILLSKDDFVKLRENIDIAVQLINNEIEENDLDDFVTILTKINKHAPSSCYKDMNDLFFWMVNTYNSLLSDCKYLVSNLPPKMDAGYGKELPAHFSIKLFRKKYKKMKKKLKI
ncbi:hypothetical protein ACQJ0K_10430 [Priestia megaterium]